MPWDFTGVTPTFLEFFADQDIEDWQSIFARVLNRDLPAAAAFREAVQLNDRFAPAWFGLGRASARLGRVADYESALKELSRLDATLAKQLADLRPRRR